MVIFYYLICYDSKDNYVKIAFVYAASDDTAVDGEFAVWLHVYCFLCEPTE